MSVAAVATEAAQIDCVPVDKVFEIIGGGTPSKRVAAYYGGDIPWATIRDMGSSELAETEHTITAAGLANSSSKLIRAGEVIMACRVGLGKACILKQDTAINQDIRALIPRASGSVDRRFCLHWLQSIAKTIIDAGSGATVQGIKLPFIKSLPFPTVPLAEQKRIVAILDQAFVALDRARANAEANLADATELFDASLRSILQSVAQRAPDRTLVELAKTIVDCEHKTAPLTEQGYPSIRTPNVGKGVLNLEGVNRVTESTYLAWTRRATPEPGDLIMAREAPAGNVAVIPPNVEVCLGQRTLLIKPDRRTTDPDYLAALLLHPLLQKRLLAKSAGATVAHVNMSDIRSLLMPHFPNLSEQQACSRRIGGVRTKVEQATGAARQKLQDLAALRQSLLQKAFAGELT